MTMRKILPAGFYVVTRNPWRKGHPFQPEGHSRELCLSLAHATAGATGERIRVVRSDGKTPPTEYAVAVPELCPRPRWWPTSVAPPTRLRLTTPEESRVRRLTVRGAVRTVEG